MAFDADRFMSANWQRREMVVDVPSLKDFFGKKEKAVWKIRSLEGQEVAQAKFAKEKITRTLAGIDAIAKLLSTDKDTITKQILDFFSYDSKADTAWRTELLILGSVDPKCDYQLAAWLHKVKPQEYYNLTNEISRLIGLGHEPGKQTPSGAMKKSKTR